MKKGCIFVVFLLLSCSVSYGQTIAEKIMKGSAFDGAQGSVDGLAKQMNESLLSLRGELKTLCEQGALLQEQGAEEEQYLTLLEQVKRVKGEIAALENRWHDVATAETKREEEGYALWDQEETTISSLVTEYGAIDHLYIVPPEMASVKLNMHSNLPIPRESWSEVLEIILAHNGVGVKNSTRMPVSSMF